MLEMVTAECDHCQRDLTTIEGGGFRLEVRAEGGYSHPGLRDLREPPMARAAYPCSGECLEGWLRRVVLGAGGLFAPSELPLGEGAT